MTTRARLPWWIGGIAAAGVLLTHWVTYRLAVPDAHHRADLLHETGHAAWPIPAALALLLFTAASVRLCVLGLRGERTPRFGPTARRLMAVQAGLWVVVEVGERAVGGHLATLDDHGVLLVGLVVQLVVALLAAALGCLAHRALSTWSARRAPARRRSRSIAMPAVESSTVRPLPLVGACGLRGPPVALRPL